MPWCTALAGVAAFGGIRIAANLIQGRPWHENVGRDAAIGGAIGLTLGLAAPAALETAALGGGTRAVATTAAQRAISVTEKGFAHVLERHVAGGALTAGKSLFSGGEKAVRALIDAAGSVVPTLQEGGNYQRIVDAGKAIGVDRATGAATSVYTVITNKAGELVTAFPGVP